MKKLYSLLTYLLFGAAVFVSCETQEPMDTDQPTDQPQTSSLGEIKVTVPSSENSIEMSWENKDAIALRCQEDSKADPTVCTYTATLAAPKATVTLKKKSGEKKIYYISAEGMIGDDGEATVDGIHFTDLGMMRYVEHILPTVKKALRK